MSNIHENALILLRYMLEKGLIAPKGMSPRELQAFLRMSDNDFDSAENFLLQGHLVEGAGGQDGVRWLTPMGVQYVSEAKKQREPLGLDAERILRFAIYKLKNKQPLNENEILEGLNVSLEQLNDACQQLLDFEYIEEDQSSGELIYIPTKLGRQAVHRDFQKVALLQSIQAGAIFNGPVSGGNIQGIANVINSEIQQNVSILTPEELHEEIERTLDKLLESVTDHLTLQQKAAYIQLAAQLQKELSKSNPDPGNLHKLLAGLGLLSDLGGALDFSHKTFELIVKAGPYIMLLGQLIVQSMQNAAR